MIQNQLSTLFKHSCVLETYLGRVRTDFGLPHGVPKEVHEASARHSKTSSFQLGHLGRLQNGFWTPFGLIGAEFL